jgi:hypothetical protein
LIVAARWRRRKQPTVVLSADTRVVLLVFQPVEFLIHLPGERPVDIMWGALCAPQGIVVGALSALYVLHRIPAVLIKSTALERQGYNWTVIDCSLLSWTAPLVTMGKIAARKITTYRDEACLSSKVALSN